jgi:hypothetical protein
MAQDYDARLAAGSIEVLHKEKSLYMDAAELEKLLKETGLVCDSTMRNCNSTDSEGTQPTT